MGGIPSIENAVNFGNIENFDILLFAKHKWFGVFYHLTITMQIFILTLYFPFKGVVRSKISHGYVLMYLMYYFEKYQKTTHETKSRQ